MKIGIRRNNHFQSDKWKDKNPNKQNLIKPIPPQDTPTIEFLTAYPPKYRINGQIVFAPKGMTHEEYYNRYMGEEQHLSTFNEKNEGLHPLRKQYLKNRLQELDYLERRQSHQDDFTTRMYGKKDFSEEKTSIINELQQGKQTISPSIKVHKTKGEALWQRLKQDQDLDKEFGHRNIPPAIQHAIDDYRKESPQEYQQQKEEQRQWERDQALGKPFQTQSLEEWKKKDAQYTNNEAHCNTAMGSILKARGIDLPANTSMNDIIKYMRNSPEWEEIPMREEHAEEHQIANEWAKQGHTAVFGQLGKEHGHGGVLTGNSTMFESGNFRNKNGEKIFVPEIEGSIGTNPISKDHLGWHLTSGKNASYFLYVGPEENNNQQKEQTNE